MSATNRGAERQPDDYYSTPGWCTRAILPHLPKGLTLDPCAGDGAILEELGDREVLGIELNPGRACSSPSIQCEDALKTDWPDTVLVLTNPPYSLAMEFVLKALHSETQCVAMLLRLNWLASKGRASFHKQYPADVYVLPKRPSFTQDGKTDATEYAWFVWGLTPGGHWYIL